MMDGTAQAITDNIADTVQVEYRTKHTRSNICTPVQDTGNVR